LLSHPQTLVFTVVSIEHELFNTSITTSNLYFENYGTPISTRTRGQGGSLWQKSSFFQKPSFLLACCPYIWDEIVFYRWKDISTEFNSLSRDSITHSESHTFLLTPPFYGAPQKKKYKSMTGRDTCRFEAKKKKMVVSFPEKQKGRGIRTRHCVHSRPSELNPTATLPSLPLLLYLDSMLHLNHNPSGGKIRLDSSTTTAIILSALPQPPTSGIDAVQA
jgi:hypothetical protein